MSTLAAKIQTFVEDNTKNSTPVEVERKMASILAEKELDRNIAEARKEYKEGKGEILDDNFIRKFTAELAQE